MKIRENADKIVIVGIIVLILLGLGISFSYVNQTTFKFKDTLIGVNADGSKLYFKHGYVVDSPYSLPVVQIGGCYSVYEQNFGDAIILQSATGCSP